MVRKSLFKDGIGFALQRPELHIQSKNRANEEQDNTLFPDMLRFVFSQVHQHRKQRRQIPR
jgi:hypothetical protein